jgi:ketosteroid isomerase-like protein
VTRDGVAIARELLDRLEAGVTARDASALDELCTSDVVLFGTAAANVGSEEVGRYLRLVVDSNSTIRWLLDRWSVVHHDDEHLLVAATGHVEFDEGEGPERSEFRLSLWLLREAGDWKIGHFHGSVPEA